jgi:predicted Zn-dependent protease
MMPNNPHYLDTCGQILLIAKRPTEAIAMLEKAASFYPDMADIRALEAHINTRRQLEKAYRLVNMNELADSHLSVIADMEKILNQIKEEKSANAPADPNDTAQDIEVNK